MNLEENKSREDILYMCFIEEFEKNDMKLQLSTIIYEHDLLEFVSNWEFYNFFDEISSRLDTKSKESYMYPKYTGSPISNLSELFYHYNEDEHTITVIDAPKKCSSYLLKKIDEYCDTQLVNVINDINIIDKKIKNVNIDNVMVDRDDRKIYDFNVNRILSVYNEQLHVKETLKFNLKNLKNAIIDENVVLEKISYKPINI